MSMYHRIREHTRLEATSENCLVQPPPLKAGSTRADCSGRICIVIAQRERNTLEIHRMK